MGRPTLSPLLQWSIDLRALARRPHAAALCRLGTDRTAAAPPIQADTASVGVQLQSTTVESAPLVNGQLRMGNSYMIEGTDDMNVLAFCTF